MPTARCCFGVGVINGIVYAVGGSGPLATVEAYDPITNTWTTKASMPTARQDLAVGVVNGILYAVGGDNGSVQFTTVEAYDPITNTWSTKAPMPTARHDLTAGVVNGVLYTLAGAAPGGSSAINVVEAYNPATNTWSTKTPMPTAAFLAGVGVIDGILYAAGGSQGNGDFALLQAYDDATDTWTTKTPMPTARAGLAVGVIDGILYAVGGESGCIGCSTTLFATVEAYDPATDTWTTKAPMPAARDLLSAGVVNGVLYALGGIGSLGGSAVSTNEAFTPLAYSCAGFDPPFDAPISLKSKVNRAIPLKMQLESDGDAITDLNIAGAAPVVNIVFSAGGSPAIDVTADLLPLGQSDSGNQFRFDVSDGRWIFNLSTKSFTTAGTYTVTAIAGETHYLISPTCTGQFVRQ